MPHRRQRQALERVRVGLILSALIGLGNLPMLWPDINWGADEPPYGWLVLAAVIGMVACVAVAWRDGNRLAIRLNATALIVNALMVVPGLFADLTAFMKVLSGVFVLAPVIAVVLTGGTRSRTPRRLDRDR